MDHPGGAEQSTAGAPRAVTVAADGSRVVYLRSDRLWVLEVTSGEERLVADVPIDGYATDGLCRVAAATSAGRLLRVRVDDGAIEEPRATSPVSDPRPDPTGRRLGYLTGGSLRVIDDQGRDVLLAGEPGVVWGTADRASADVFGRHRGYWWSPDGERILASRVAPPATVTQRSARAADGFGGMATTDLTSLHLLDLDGFWVDVRWDRQAYPHLVAVAWEPRGGPLVTVLPRSQHHALVLAVDARTGETQVHAELDDPRWVSVTPGTPAYLPDGRVVLGGELSLDTVDTRCLFADGILLTPPTMYVRRLCGRMAGPDEHSVDLIVEASEREPSECHVYRVRVAAKSGNPEVTRLTQDAGWHTGHAAGTTLVIRSESLDHPGVRTTVHGAAGIRQVPAFPADSATPPRPVLSRVTDRRLPCAVLYPTEHVAGRRLPVLVDVSGDPQRQGVVAARGRWWPRQWYADQGFAVVVVDSRGTPGISPGFEKAIYRRVADIMLTDQVDALAALGAKHPDLDPVRVAILGAGLGGWLAVAAVLGHPDVYRAAVACDPITDWTAEPAGYAERYLGSSDDNPEAYLRHDLVTAASGLTRPVLVYPRTRRTERLAGLVELTDSATPRQIVDFIRTTLGGGS